MERFEKINNMIWEGNEKIQKNDFLGGCDKWLEAWEEVKALFTEGIASDIYDLNKKYNWTEFISNWVQDLETELHNAGIDEKIYHSKRAVYCEELLQWCGSNDLIIENTRRGMADSYFDSGDEAKAEQLYSEWLRKDPDWGWGYIGWSDCYWFGLGEKYYEKAEEILLTGYARIGLRDKEDVVDRLIGLYEDMGQQEKVEEYRKTRMEIQPIGEPYYSPTPITVEKIGRNEPCPCGSGKKYKKCCGA